MMVNSLRVIAGVLAAMALGNVRAQSLREFHGHPPQDAQIHQKFYSTWMEPDNRGISCCHNEDCSPAESKFVNGRWMARKAGDEGPFTQIPNEKIEHDRDTPDGRSHLCGRRDPWNGSQLLVFCFIPGAGG